MRYMVMVAGDDNEPVPAGLTIDTDDARAWLNELRARIPDTLPEVRSDGIGGWWIAFPAGAYGLVPAVGAAH